MKKLATILLALMLAFTMTFMCACGSSEDADDNGADQETTQAANVDDEEDDSYYDGPGYEEYNPNIDYDLDHTFKNHYRLDEHYEKHGEEMGFESPEEYEWAADQVIHNPNTLHKIEKEDGDDVYYLPDTNEFVVVAPNGTIRTYFEPDSGIKYYNKQ